jgi:hypothetical protein
VKAASALPPVPAARSPTRTATPSSTIFRTGRLLAPAMLRLPCQPTAAVVTHPTQDVEQRAVAPRRVRLIHHADPAAPVALDAQEPRREGPERLLLRLGGRGQRLIAVWPPAPPGGRHSHPAHPMSATTAAVQTSTFPQSMRRGWRRLQLRR